MLVDHEATTIVGGAGDKAIVEGRCKELWSQIDRTKSDYDRKKQEERLAKLAPAAKPSIPSSSFLDSVRAKTTNAAPEAVNTQVNTPASRACVTE